MTICTDNLMTCNTISWCKKKVYRRKSEQFIFQYLQIWNVSNCAEKIVFELCQCISIWWFSFLITPSRKTPWVLTFPFKYHKNQNDNYRKDIKNSLYLWWSLVVMMHGIEILQYLFLLCFDLNTYLLQILS